MFAGVSGIILPMEKRNEFDSEKLLRNVSESLLASATAVSEASHRLVVETTHVAEIITEVFFRGGKLLICGNGGSAADSQHIAAELVGRFRSERRALPAIALTTDSSILTSLANDYEVSQMFSRQVRAAGHEGDVLLAISTSGSSPNVLAAVKEARAMSITTIGLTGSNGDDLVGACDFAVKVPADETARIQEIHLVMAHAFCGAIEAAFVDE
jgi:D-sedoheptulose 7-phosphate isomerase